MQMFAFPFWFLYEAAYEHSEAHILKMYPSVWVRYLYRSAQKNSGYVTASVGALHNWVSKFYAPLILNTNLTKRESKISYL